MHQTLGPYELNTIITGDARELAKAIPDESVDLIFTDPVYDEPEDYAFLAKLAHRVLTGSGALLLWSNGKWHKKHTKWLEAFDLVYRWDFASVHHGGGSPMNGKIIAKTNRLIWFDCAGQSSLNGYLPDGHLSKPWGGPKEFKWTKNPRLTSLGIEALAPMGGIVFDPFAGGGTIPAMAYQTHRYFIGFEIIPERAELSRKRIGYTQQMFETLLPNKEIQPTAQPRLFSQD